MNREMDQRDTGQATILGAGEKCCLAPQRLRSLHSPPWAAPGASLVSALSSTPVSIPFPLGYHCKSLRLERQSPGGLGTLVESYCGCSPAFRVNKTCLRQSFQSLLWKIKMKPVLYLEILILLLFLSVLEVLRSKYRKGKKIIKLRY